MYLQAYIFRLAALANCLLSRESIATTTSMADNREARYLFGGNQPWNTTTLIWKAVDDRVRGGSSQSYLDPIKSRGDSDVQSAKFYGNLDTKTLGGAGFASRSTKALSDNMSENDIDEPVWDLSSYHGLLLGIDSADNKTYTITLKDDLPGTKRNDGREMSGVSWEADFVISADQMKQNNDQVILTEEANAARSKTLVRIPWSQFKATYRGREKPDTDPLKTAHIRRFALMMRSFFEKQEGGFELVVDYIAAYRSSRSS